MKDALLCAEIENEPRYKQKKRFPKMTRHSMDPVVPANYYLRMMRYCVCVGWFCDRINVVSVQLLGNGYTTPYSMNLSQFHSLFTLTE